MAPKVFLFAKDHLVMEFIDGKLVGDYLEEASSKDAKKVIMQTLEQMFTLDCQNITKEEMHHPHKHVIVSKGKPWLIDFERAHYDERPSNVTQFCQFLTSSSIAPILAKKDIIISKQECVRLAKLYKRSPSRKVFERILALLN